MSTNTLSAQPKRLIGYFPSWGIHAQNYHVADIPAGQLTHVIYAFAGLNSDGICVSINADDDGINFPRLRQLKQLHPNVQTLISVGGASHSKNFANAASTDALRVHCAQSCVQFMRQNGFDGIDIDWEYPAAADSQNFTALLTELRRQLDASGATDKRTYLLTIAAPAGADHYVNLQLNLIHLHVDWINLMAYDFTVASSDTTDFVAPLKAYDTSLLAKHAASNVDAAVQAYLRVGVPASKLVMGTRFIGTGWQGVTNSNNGLYQANKGAARGTWDAAGASPTGSFGYQNLKQDYIRSSTRFWHTDAEVPWVFDPATGIMISNEDPQSLGLKANYVVANGLAGVMIWNLSADDSQHTLLNSLVDGLGQAPPPVCPPPKIPDQLNEPALTGLITVKLAGTPADGSPSPAQPPQKVIWVDQGDGVLVHLDSMRTRILDGTVLISVDLETDQTGRTPLVVAFAVGKPNDPAGLVAVTDEFPRGNGLLASRWGRALQAAAWASLLGIATDHATERALAPLGIAAARGMLSLQAGPALKAKS